MTTGEKSQHQVLGEFYTQAQEALESLAKRFGLELPKGAATIESSCLHWRLSAYAEPAEDYWRRQWRDHAAELDLPGELKPPCRVIDQEGAEWRLLGLDPLGGLMPIRLQAEDGAESFLSVAQGQLLQRID